MYKLHFHFNIGTNILVLNVMYLIHEFKYEHIYSNLVVDSPIKLS